MNFRKDNCELFSGVKELLAELQSRNIKQHLLSAYEQNSLNSILKYFAISSYFQNIVGLDNIYASGKSHLARKLADENSDLTVQPEIFYLSEIQFTIMK